MRLLTFIEMSEIREWEFKMQQPEYVPNAAQKRLAEVITQMVHGDDGLATALRVTQGAAPGADTKLDAATLENIAQDMPSSLLLEQDVVGQKVVDMLVKVGLQPSKGEARRLMRNGGVYLNNVKVEDENAAISIQDLVEGRILLLATGKKNKVVVRIENPTCASS